MFQIEFHKHPSPPTSPWGGAQDMKLLDAGYFSNSCDIYIGMSQSCSSDEGGTILNILVFVFSSGFFLLLKAPERLPYGGDDQASSLPR